MNMEHIPSEQFRIVGPKIEEAAAPTGRHRGYAADALARFRKNGSSVAAAIVLAILLIFAIVVPEIVPYGVDFRDGYYKNALPKWEPLAILGWDGCQTISANQATFDYYTAMGAVKKVKNQTKNETTGEFTYEISLDTYEKVGWVYVDLSEAEYEALRSYEAAQDTQVIFPMPRNYQTTFLAVSSGANLWYALADPSAASTGEAARHDENGQPIFEEAYLLDEAGQPIYAVKNQTGFRCRVRYSEYYRYQNGFSPRYLFGTNQHGQDILVCLAYGARLSFLLALSVSLINFAIGIVYGAIGGYYGGRTDLLMGRISDILAAVPFIVVATLFQLHLYKRVGAVPVLLLSFVLTGWIGIASRVRTQFYRFKNAEYVLAARTLGAKDGRLIFRHILPNAIGTIITGTVLLIPGVIFSESMLSYLGIVNLESAGMTSLGTMLSGGQGYLGSFPHILLFPAVFLALLQIAFNLFGNGLRDAFNPKTQAM